MKNTIKNKRPAVNVRSAIENGDSIEGQEKAIAAYLSAVGVVATHVIIDNGQAMGQSSLMKIAELAAAGEIDSRAVSGLDRLSRNVVQLLSLQRSLERLRVSVWVLG